MPKNADTPKSFWSAVGEMSSLALTLALCVIIGLLLGQWLGRRWGNESVGVLLGMTLGITAAGVELARSIKRLNQLARNKSQEGRRSDTTHTDDGQGHDAP